MGVKTYIKRVASVAKSIYKGFGNKFLGLDYQKELHCFIDDKEVSMEECDLDNKPSDELLGEEFHDESAGFKRKKKKKSAKQKKKSKKKEIKKARNKNLEKSLDRSLLETSLKKDEKSLEVDQSQAVSIPQDSHLETIIISSGKIVQRIYLTPKRKRVAVNCLEDL